MTRVASWSFAGAARWVLGMGIAGALTVALAGPAAAHANLDSSDPAASALLDHAPAEVTMTFTEPPDPKLSIVHVLDVTGKEVEAGPVEGVPGNPDQLRIPLPPDLPDGVYTVSWRVVSEADGHFTADAFSFGVNVAPGTAVTPSIPTPTVPPPSVASVAGKVGLYAGLAVLFAAAVVGSLAFAGNVPARRPVLLGAAAAAALGALVMLVAERATLGVSLGDLLSSSTGADFLWLLGGVAFAAIVAVDASRRSGTGPLVLVGIAAAAAMLIRAIGGHASAVGIPALEIGLQWVHFMAASIWIGGLLLAFLSLRALRDAGGAPVAAIRRYSSLAGYALVVVLVTGVLRAMEEVGGLSKLLHLFDTSYSTTLDIKVGVVIVLIGLGGFNRYRSIPRLSESAGLLRRVMAIELVGAVGVFGLTGTLTGLSPRPPAPPPPPEPPSVTLTGSDFATTMKVRLVVTPGSAGPNGFDTRVTAFDSDAPVNATDVALRFVPVGRPGVGASTLELMHHGDHWMANGTQLSIAGAWTITVVVQTASSGTEIPLTLVTSIPDQDVSVSAAAGQPSIYTFAFPNGEQLQTYNDPATSGTDELHLTAFDADGKELPLSRATMVAVGPDGEATSLQPRRFSAGHLVGDLTLTAGTWTFFVQATARDGRVLTASFEQTI